MMLLVFIFSLGDCANIGPLFVMTNMLGNANWVVVQLSEYRKSGTCFTEEFQTANYVTRLKKTTETKVWAMKVTFT